MPRRLTQTRLNMLPAFSIVIPCFNEEVRIGQTLRLTLDYLATNTPESELIVVNDGSTDATGAVARERLKSAQVTTRLLENFPNRGKGAAVRSGLLAARTPIGVFSDADLSTPLEETPKLIKPIANREVEIAFGSRALDRNLIGIHQPWRREQAGRVLICWCGLPPDCRFGTRNADLKRFALRRADRFLKRRGSKASRSTWSCFISPVGPVCGFAKFQCVGTTPKAVKLAFSATAYACWGK